MVQFKTLSSVTMETFILLMDVLHAVILVSKDVPFALKANVQIAKLVGSSFKNIIIANQSQMIIFQYRLKFVMKFSIKIVVKKECLFVLNIALNAILDSVICVNKDLYYLIISVKQIAMIYKQQIRLVDLISVQIIFRKDVKHTKKESVSVAKLDGNFSIMIRNVSQFVGIIFQLDQNNVILSWILDVIYVNQSVKKIVSNAYNRNGIQ
ncbi:hypothetical protein FGO68_gene12055 [Halteria grandinella]|uniref:Uncharacterized protein n=1 Tax=Halteria grandinella TaxID=5974 RepID=A0A8J8NHN3_HALGN|nr:hypothetical protein FGO68_gene12055 [Halteria grandinella]